jgi:hypothetical protein
MWLIALFIVLIFVFLIYIWPKYFYLGFVIVSRIRHVIRLLIANKKKNFNTISLVL